MTLHRNGTSPRLSVIHAMDSAEAWPAIRQGTPFVDFTRQYEFRPNSSHFAQPDFAARGNFEATKGSGGSTYALRATADNLRVRSMTLACQPEPASGASVLAKVGGEAGIRTLGTTLRSYNGLANRRLQPLGHLTTES